ncbi:MAG TPA: glycosyltransferase N-terminal domain-containing protein [Bacteroidales bacterium]|nr:3-deoxy-D-manno-octulosonic acid transferase [Bacteroidales bacterium]HNV95412.1 glycosyltransferase N-terminal domain-containing protein [Bacteroidales bacterium]
MMLLFYRIGLWIYAGIIHIVSLFNNKALLWIRGRKNIWKRIADIKLNSEEKVIWMHVSSLGEFEQGRPLIEELKKQNQNVQIVLTFFSPSGYEIRKNYSNANAVFYLPIDSPRNARKWYDLIKPDYVIFVKYDFWYYYIREAHLRNIPIILISAVFKPYQIFFKWYGRFYRKMLGFFNFIFVQDANSAIELKKININAEVAGDTRCDRVIQIAQNPLPLNEVKAFIQNRFTIVVGSMWNEDMQVLKDTINSSGEDIVWIIASHNIEDSYISLLEKQITKPALRYSQLQDSKDKQFQVLFIDNIGKLSSLYQFAKIAYIGGGFGKGIHNILEPAVYGVPVVFGPKYHKFNEAVEMVSCNAAFCVKNQQEAKSIFEVLIHNELKRNAAATSAYNYIKSKAGATALIIQKIYLN